MGQYFFSHEFKLTKNATFWWYRNYSLYLMSCVLWFQVLQGQIFRSFCLLEEVLFLNTWLKKKIPQTHPDRVSLPAPHNRKGTPQGNGRDIFFHCPFPGFLLLWVWVLASCLWNHDSTWHLMVTECKMTLWPERVCKATTNLHKCLF